MTSPPKRKPGLAGTGLKTNSTERHYHHAQRLQSSLGTRLNRTASIGEIMPNVLMITVAQLEAARTPR